MRRIQLTTAAQEQLEHLFKTTNDRRLRDRCQAVLMASRGRKRQTIAQDLGVHRTTVQLWLKHYRARGYEGIAEPRGTGPTEAASPDVGVDDSGVGESRPGGLWARSGERDLRRAGDVWVSDHGNRREADGHAGLLSAPCHPAGPADLALCARRPRRATGGPGRTGGVKKN
jgi:Homeodomain-like domain